MSTNQNQFEWQEITTQYQDIRQSSEDEELRWIITKEKILNRENGQAIFRSFIRHPGICVIIPQINEDQILMMRQYRYAPALELWELPAGTLSGREENHRMIATETPEECAARELKEETGYKAEKLEKIVSCYAMPGSSDELIHLFLASNLAKGEQELDAGEVIYEIRGFSKPEIEAMIEKGEIRDAKTLIGLFYALRRK